MAGLHAEKVFAVQHNVLVISAFRALRIEINAAQFKAIPIHFLFGGDRRVQFLFFNFIFLATV